MSSLHSQLYAFLKGPNTTLSQGCNQWEVCSIITLLSSAVWITSTKLWLLCPSIVKICGRFMPVLGIKCSLNQMKARHCFVRPEPLTDKFPSGASYVWREFRDLAVLPFIMMWGGKNSPSHFLHITELSFLYSRWCAIVCVLTLFWHKPFLGYETNYIPSHPYSRYMLFHRADHSAPLHNAVPQSMMQHNQDSCNGGAQMLCSGFPSVKSECRRLINFPYRWIFYNVVLQVMLHILWKHHR